MIIENKYIPVKGFKAMAIWPFIFVRKGCNIDEITLNHEHIHFEQQKELFIIGFYSLYLYYHLKYGYYNNPFESEAYTNEYNTEYINNRKSFAWLKYK